MSQALQDLLDCLTLSPISPQRFEAGSQDFGLPQIFGGQIMAQSLIAAAQAVDPLSLPHSFHCHFLIGGDPNEKLIFENQRLRHGNNFSVVETKAYQKDNLIYQATISFQKEEEGADFQPNAVQAPACTENFTDENHFYQAIAAQLPDTLRELFSASLNRPFEVKIQYPQNPFLGKTLPPQQTVWARTFGEKSFSALYQRALMLYFSDFYCLPTILHPLGKGALQKGIRMATLSHSMHFYRHADFNQWLCFLLETENCFAARGLVSGKILDKSHRLIAHFQQEGLIRQV